MIDKSRHMAFTKMVASGNDFVVVQGYPDPGRVSPVTLAKKICDRKYGIGADGMLLLQGSKRADIKMRILNADGSEADMCGNGARCAALFQSRSSVGVSKVRIETKAGIIQSEVRGNEVRIKLTDPHAVRLDIPIKLNTRPIKANFINTGVPHTVIFVQGLEEIDVVALGRLIRFHKQFLPAGTNVNFVEIMHKRALRVRTYERGVEDETLACGTGSTASALIYALKSGIETGISVETKSKEVLFVSFEKSNEAFKNVWLRGNAHFVAKGTFFFTRKGG